MSSNKANLPSSVNDSYQFSRIEAHNATFQIDQSFFTLLLKWDPFTDIENFKAGWLFAIELIKEFQIRKVLHNATNLAFISIESYNWMLKNIISQLVANNIIKVSRVVAPVSLTAHVSGKYLSRIQDACQHSPCKCEFFKNEESAFIWLHAA